MILCRNEQYFLLGLTHLTPFLFIYLFIYFLNFFTMDNGEQHKATRVSCQIELFLRPVSSDHTDFIREYNKLDLRS